MRALVEVACSGTSRPQPPGQPGVRTHQLLLAILAAAQHGGRRGIARELRDGLLHRGDYRGSREELTPGGGDLLAGLPVTLTAAGHAGPARGVAVLHQRQHRGVLAHPGGLGRAQAGGRRGWPGPAGRLKRGQGTHHGPFGIMMV